MTRDREKARGWRFPTRFLGLGSEATEPSTRRARLLCVASGKGGVGKSVLSTNLAVLRARRGERVLLIDFDAGMANAHLLMGVSPRYDLGHVLDGDVDALAALAEGPAGVQLLSGGVGRGALAQPTRRELDRLFRALVPLEAAFDLILIDHGAGLGYATQTHLAAARSLLLVTQHEVTALSDGYAFYKRALGVNPDLRVGLVMNRAPDHPTAEAGWERFRSVAHRFLGKEPEYLGWIPQDPAIALSVARRSPLALEEPGSPAALALRKIAGWDGFDAAATPRAFFDRARAALR